MAREVPLERLQLETDGPWCEIRASHAGYVGFLKGEGEEEVEEEVEGKGEGRKGFEGEVKGRRKGFEKVKKEKWREGVGVKGRNEPWEIVKVARVVAGVKGVGVEEVGRAAWRNSVGMFGLGDEG